eukprot:350766-Chlamydomonas_euryale.AAC.1
MRPSSRVAANVSVSSSAVRPSHGVRSGRTHTSPHTVSIPPSPPPQPGAGAAAAAARAAAATPAGATAATGRSSGKRREKFDVRVARS